MGIFKKKNNYFFDSFIELTLMSKECLEVLIDGFKNFNQENLLELKNKVHKIEHDADMKKREIEEKLAKEFVTPIDRQDIFKLLDLIDDLTDSIDEISYKLYLRNYSYVPNGLEPFYKKSIESIDGLIEVFKHFDHINDKKVMDPLVKKVLDIEESTDKLYEECVHELYIKNNSYDKNRMAERIYSYFENITDKSRDVVKTVLIILYKNL